MGRVIKSTPTVEIETQPLSRPLLVAALLTLVYLAYQYWGKLFNNKLDDDEDGCSHSTRLPRSRSRSSSRSRTRSGSYNYRVASKHGKRRRRCPDCSRCNNLAN